MHPRLSACLLALMLAGNAPSDAPAPALTLTLTIQGLRSLRGLLQICVTARADHFPDCTRDPAARRVTVPASVPDAKIVISGLSPGNYAVAVIHDANSNRKLDTFAGIPREGVGFSRNPAFYFGPPGFNDARFPLAAWDNAQTIRMRYFL